MTFDLEGNFFRHDPARTFRQNIRVLTDDMAKQITAEVKARALPAEREGPEVAAKIVGRTGSVRGKRWAVSLVVSPYNKSDTKEQAKRIFAMAAGRHNPMVQQKRGKGWGGVGTYNIGVTKGVEGKTKAWAKTRRLVKLQGKAITQLLKGIA